MDGKNYFQRVQAQTSTRFWINNVTREQANVAIDAGAVGCTQNPSYPWKMIDDPKEYSYAMEILDKILITEKDDNEALVKLQKELVAKIAEIFLPMYESSGCKNGYVSIQGDPFKEDTDTILRYARFNREAGPNIMAKIPATEEGLKAIEILAAERVPINATEVMAVKQALDVCEAYEKGTRGLKNPAPIYISIITGIFDEYLHKYVADNAIDVSPDALWQAGISIAKKIYWMVKEKNYPAGFIGGGARGLHHFTEMVGSDCCVTINWKGTADEPISHLPAQKTIRRLRQTHEPPARPFQFCQIGKDFFVGDPGQRGIIIRCRFRKQIVEVWPPKLAQIVADLLCLSTKDVCCGCRRYLSRTCWTFPMR